MIRARRLTPRAWAPCGTNCHNRCYSEVMADRATINVSLTPHLERFVTSRVTSGRYQSASEVVREGLRLLEEREDVRRAAIRQLRKEIAVGLEQAHRGELLDGEEVFRELGQRSEKRRSR